MLNDTNPVGLSRIVGVCVERVEVAMLEENRPGIQFKISILWSIFLDII